MFEITMLAGFFIAAISQLLPDRTEQPKHRTQSEARTSRKRRCPLINRSSEQGRQPRIYREETFLSSSPNSRNSSAGSGLLYR
jgi:hypothetical protein